MPFRTFLPWTIALTLILIMATRAALAQGAACTLDGTTLTPGQTGVFYSARSVPLGQSCEVVGQSRQCADGALSGKDRYRYDNCIMLEEFLGVNTNRRPGVLDPALLARTGTGWIRSNVDILIYKEQQETGKVDPDWNFADWQLYKEAAAGENRKAILNLMWDFSSRGLHPPKPGTAQERALFDYLDRYILDALVPYVDILTTGNEPFVNTLAEDWHPQTAYGGIPIVVFYKRLTEHVHAYLVEKGQRNRVDLYMGAFTRLRTKKMQKQPAVGELLAYAEVADFVDGVDMHTHVNSLKQIDKALNFIRSYTTKPVIVTEFTFIWSMQKAVEGGDVLGADFAGRWGRDSKQKIGDYMACEVFGVSKGCKKNGPVSKAEWDDFFATRSWYISDFILKAEAIFRKYAVRGATFGLVQSQPKKRQLNPKRPPWYMGFLFAAAAVERLPDGTAQANYQYLDDFATVQRQRAAISMQ